MSSAGAASFIKLPQLLNLGTGDSSDTALLVIWGIAEGAITTIAASIPILRALLGERITTAPKLSTLRSDDTRLGVPSYIPPAKFGDYSRLNEPSKEMIAMVELDKALPPGPLAPRLPPEQPVRAMRERAKRREGRIAGSRVGAHVASLRPARTPAPLLSAVDRRWSRWGRLACSRRP